MSIIVEGMEMPKKCNDCPFFESKYHYHGCLAKPESINNMDMWNFEVGSRPSWCPLVEQKTGKWIDGVCSICNEGTDIVESRYFNYCPYCGAKMEFIEAEDEDG